MAHLDVRAFIRATPQAIWDVIADIEGQQAWMADVREIEILSDQKSGSGTVVKVTSELFGRPVVHDVMEITVWDAPHRFEVVHRGQFSGWGAFVIEPVTGGSVFTWIEDFKPPLGPLGELGFSLLVGPHLQRTFGKSMDNLRRIAETS